MSVAPSSTNNASNASQGVSPRSAGHNGNNITNINASAISRSGEEEVIMSPGAAELTSPLVSPRRLQELEKQVGVSEASQSEEWGAVREHALGQEHLASKLVRFHTHMLHMHACLHARVCAFFPPPEIS